MKPDTFTYDGILKLERGGRLRSPAIAYRQWGKPSPDGSNVVWVCHALTANTDVFDWWPGLFGPGQLFNPDDWCIICANVLGSCYGSTGPLSHNPETGKPYFSDFPDITIRDMVAAHQLLAANLGIDHIGLIIGGSMGGQQALEWAVQEPDRFAQVAVVATNAVHSPWGVAFNETQRMAIEADATWGEPRPDAGSAGLRAARAMALLSYRHYDTYAVKQSPREGDSAFRRRAASYQQYQGDKLVRRFNAYSYYTLSNVMDSHDLGRGRGGVEQALNRIKAQVLAIGIENDILFPPIEQKRIANGVRKGTYQSIEALEGHDGFLIETGQISHIINQFISAHYLNYQKLNND